MSARAIVLAAGKGTRMKSARPKVLHALCGRPMLWWVLEALRAGGVDDVTVVTNPELDPSVAAFGARTVVQREQLGTGHAVRIALDALPPRDGTLVVAYGDMPLAGAEIFADVQAALDADAGTALALVTARMPLPSSFGRIIRSAGAAAVAKIVESKDCTPAELAVDEMNAGIYAYDEGALRDAIVRVGSDNAQGEFYLTDTVELLIAAGRRVVPVPASDYRSVLGVNDRVELANARAVLNRRLCEDHMRAGVTIVDPAAVSLEPGVAIAPDVTILPNVMLCGATRIGSETVVGPNARLTDAAIGERCEIRESVVTASEIGDDVSVGPFAHVRGHARLGAGVRIGNFVELKNTEMAEGAKAAHLSYLGDASVGERSNIGAGTITANFDGVRKNRTQVGADVRIGSNTVLVAPVDVGDGALTGAGAVVTRDVPAGERVAGVPARTIAKKSAPSP
ncbi:bifunctional protein GlmU [Vulcanimicrobium alpinum]|uniref:Bifunctional protein GlmU n=1 Tax=Vulcanimicrobium alpinum TaxID=3016050 RepID=A0AAN1Y091_UNVUL|nr:bifunctional UDP-N-acetylglucosamine diphosphorylase/glucosamine-1-phosphate N-acetyltransferase GlmU [Vulcanimicrobium alpinum]BDE07838.1 bifunctional protein GlmU [Vulcanimicrobium alpinum]